MPEQNQPEPGEPQQIVLMRRLVDLSVERTRLSEDRSEMSASRSYMNAERTLSVWVRTALAAMTVGIAIDRFRLVLLQHPESAAASGPDQASAWTGGALVAFGVLMVAVTGIRFWRYAAAYRHQHAVPEYHGPFMAPVFALLAGVFGIAMLVLLLVAP